jgi:hypothetical protein
MRTGFLGLVVLLAGCGAHPEPAGTLPPATGDAGLASTHPFGPPSLFVTLLVEDLDHGPATLTMAETWRDHYALTKVGVVADPKFTFKKPSGNGIPMNVLVDPRTMVVLDKFQGAPDRAEVDALVANRR